MRSATEAEASSAESGSAESGSAAAGSNEAGSAATGIAAAGSNEAGSIAAEFAAAVPAVVMVLVFCLAGVQVAGQQVRLQDAAAIASRSIARAESANTALERARYLAPEANLSTRTGGDIECVVLSERASGPASLLRLSLTARSCSLAGGR